MLLPLKMQYYKCLNASKTRTKIAHIFVTLEMNGMKNKWALITGASSGIGKELAIIHAKNGGNVLLISRDQTALETLASELMSKLAVVARILPLDLTSEDAIDKIQKHLKENEMELHCLINNAGFGGYGQFTQRDIKKDCNMIDLNIKALVALTYCCIPFMAKTSSTYILNIASIAAFFPGPFQATYFATKAFVLSFSHGLSTELKNSNISVTAACPGPVKTNFEQNAQMESLGLFKNALSAEKTAHRAYRAMLRKRKEIITDYSIGLPIRILLPFLPTSIKSYIIYRIQKPSK